MPIKEKYRRKSPQIGEAGFTLIEMIIALVLASILGIFVFQVLTKSLETQIDMQVRKERSDDAVRTMDKVNREFREASNIYAAVNNVLFFKKNVSSSSDPNLYVVYSRNTVTDILTRQSAPAIGGPWTAASVIATDISRFDTSQGANSRLTIQVEFANDGSDWVTYLMPRNKP